MATGVTPGSGTGTVLSGGASQTRTAAAPTLSFNDAVTQYQQSHAVSAESYTGLYTYLQGLGFQVERPTHAGGTLQSDDKIVNSQTGEVFDLIYNVGGADQRWTFGSSGYWYDGKPQDRPRAAPAPPDKDNPDPRQPDSPPDTGPTGPPPNGPPGGSSSTPTYRAPDTVNPYAAARNAQSRIRAQARFTGRSSTILGGFNAGTPNTRLATVLGGRS